MLRVLLSLALLIVPAIATAEARIALIVGNGAYRNVSTLDNAAQDARLISAALVANGFKVTLVLDADQASMMQSIGKFGRALREAGPEATGLFYYAGHGVQSFGKNYLVPVDAELHDAADLGLVAVPADTVLLQMNSARNRTNIMILDACRNNPFEAILDLTDNGLAEMKAPTGTFLAYSTAPGAVALDGIGANSPFTSALATLIPTPGLAIEELFREVRVKVLEATGGLQTPWDASSLTQAFYFAAPPDDDAAAEAALWQQVKASGDPLQIMLFLRGYPASPFAEEAKKLAAELTSRQAAAAAPPPDIAAAAVQDTAAPQENETPPELVTFTSAFRSGEGISGKSIEDIIAGSPLYPPIEGLPDEVWKGRHCTDCHQWTRDALCTQAKTYASESVNRALQKVHPMGADFKRGLRDWARSGCP